MHGRASLHDLLHCWHVIAGRLYMVRRHSNSDISGSIALCSPHVASLRFALVLCLFSVPSSCLRQRGARTPLSGVIAVCGDAVDLWTTATFVARYITCLWRSVGKYAKLSVIVLPSHALQLCGINSRGRRYFKGMTRCSISAPCVTEMPTSCWHSKLFNPSLQLPPNRTVFFYSMRVWLHNLAHRLHRTFVECA